MIPLRDVIPSRTTPVVTVALILLNGIVFLYGRLIGTAGLDELLRDSGRVPASSSWIALFTSTFLHSSWLHLVSNLWCLWLFGENVEDRFGRVRFLLFYLLAGLAGALFQMWWSPASNAPVAGASGAIAGVLGAYVVMFAHSRILVLVVLLFYLEIVEVHVLIVMGVWFAVQLFAIDTIAYVGHIGGFAAGLAAVWAFRRRERESPDWWTA